MKYLDKWLLGNLEKVEELRIDSLTINQSREFGESRDFHAFPADMAEQHGEFNFRTLKEVNLNERDLYAFYMEKQLICFGQFHYLKFEEFLLTSFCKAHVIGDVYYAGYLTQGICLDIYSTEANDKYINLYQTLSTDAGQAFIKETRLKKEEITDTVLTQEILNEFSHWKTIQAIIEDHPSDTELDEKYEFEQFRGFDQFCGDTDVFDCPDCTEVLEQGFNYCPDCGYSLKGE